MDNAFSLDQEYRTYIHTQMPKRNKFIERYFEKVKVFELKARETFLILRNRYNFTTSRINEKSYIFNLILNKRFILYIEYQILIGRLFRKIFSVRDEKIMRKNISSGIRFKNFHRE